MILGLPETHPDAHQTFVERYHVVRCTDMFWAGLSTHVIIDQGPMGNINTHGDLTRERGMVENQHLMLVLSMPVCICK